MNGTLLGQTKENDTLVFLYDEKANKYGFDYNGNKYYYIFNLQGDVIGILNQAGTQVVSYQYDAWGKVLSVDGTQAATIGQLNPIRYRGYYYDTETGFYYLQSRYYDPITRRFLNADSVISGMGRDVRGHNLFNYCFNNPINMSDQSGHLPQAIKNVANGVINVMKTAANIAISAKSSHNQNRRPNTGTPGSTWKAPNGDTRTYGPDGRPLHDYDHDDHGFPDQHPHDENGGHNHDWDWANDPPRGPAYAFDWEPVVGVALVAVCVIGIIVVAADDATGIGVADDFLFGPLGSGVGEGLILIFG